MCSTNLLLLLLLLLLQASANGRLVVKAENVVCKTGISDMNLYASVEELFVALLVQIFKVNFC